MPAPPLRLLAVADARSIHTIRWAQRLAERGHELHVVTDRPGAVAGVTVHDVRRLDAITRVPRLRRLRIGAAIGNLAAGVRADVVHAHGMLPYALWAAQARVHPLVVSPWGSDVLVHAQREPGRSRARRGFAAADALVVNSRALLEASAALGADASRALLVLWHARLDGFSPDRADRAGLRRELGWPADALVLLSLRNFRPDTNIDTLVRAFARVHRQEPRARLLLAARAGPLRAQIAALVAQQRLDDVAQLHRVEPDGLPRLIASADVAVTLTASDSAPPSLLEAMASGLPIVAAWSPSLDEWVGPGEGAEMVPPRDEDALVAALLRMARDPALRAAHGERNARVAGERGAEATPALEALYRELRRTSAVRSSGALRSTVST